MGRWIRIDRRYNQPYRLTTYASRAIFKWTRALYSSTRGRPGPARAGMRIVPGAVT